MLSTSTSSAPASIAALHLIERVALDFDLRARRRELARAAHGDANVAVDGLEVVVLDQHRAREIEAVIRAAAGAHGVLLELAPARRRLPRVEDLRAAFPSPRRRTSP